MESVEQILCMSGGDGEASYATNSIHQRQVMLRAKGIVEETLTKVYKRANSPNCLNVADLGCASGPNPLLFIEEVMDIISRICDEMKHEMPEVQVFLNDLPSNDFKEIFKSFPGLYLEFEKENKQCFVAAMPGTFYGRLFPSNSLHFVHSSYALHWLSQVPRGLINENGKALNDRNVCLAESSGPLVHKIYYEQFEKDFHSFLKSRSQEMVSGGGMVLTIVGSVESKHQYSTMEVIGLALYDMADEGLIEKSKLDKFNTPNYHPSAEEISKVVETEGSFKISRLESHDTPWGANMPKDAEGEVTDIKKRAEFVANLMIAAAGPLLAAYFGEAVFEELCNRLSDRFAERMKTNSMECYFHNIVVSLKKVI